MSYSQLNCTQSQTNPNITSPHDLSALANTLQAAAQTLFAMQTKMAPDTPQESNVKPLARKDGGETRSYYFPPGAVHLEKELLRKYRAEDFQGLLEEAHTLLVGLVKLMQSVHKDVRVKGYVIASLGAQLDHASALVLRMRNVYDKVMPVQTKDGQ